MLRLQRALPVGLGTPASASRRQTAARVARSTPTQRKIRRTTSALSSTTSKRATPFPASRPT
jgi:hypothetical protein